MTEPEKQPADDTEPSLSSPADIASAARSCLVILAVLAAIGLLLCVAFAVSRIT